MISALMTWATNYARAILTKHFSAMTKIIPVPFSSKRAAFRLIFVLLQADMSPRAIWVVVCELFECQNNFLIFALVVPLETFIAVRCEEISRLLWKIIIISPSQARRNIFAYKSILFVLE